MSSESSPFGEVWPEERLRAALPLPAADAHKYSRGTLAVIAGSKRYPGAVCLAARAGQRIGAGYTEVVTDKSAKALVLGYAPSLVVHDASSWHPDEWAKPKRNAPRAVCIGPGFDPNDTQGEELLLGTLKKARCPVLVDGGALAFLGSKKARKALAKRRASGLATILTPHAGEAARLIKALGLQAAEDASARASAIARASGTIVVAKGPDTFVSDGDATYPMREGTAALAKAGTGDVLAGMVAGLLAQGTTPVEAAVLGATLHARAGKAAALRYTDVGVTPEDVIEAIPAAIRSLTEPKAD